MKTIYKCILIASIAMPVLIYRFVRNPMYIGAGLALAGAAFFYESWPLLRYTGFFLLATYLFVVCYEERVLRRTFGQEYEAYCSRVGRWWPRVLDGI
jgi:protein-S-isoprenylcysteine O-methyltransferase Ste14